MAVVKVTIPDDILEKSSSPEQLVQDVRLVVLRFWVARGLIREEQIPELMKTAQVDVEPASPSRDRLGLKEVLLAMPEVPDETVFDRVKDFGRKDPPWDS